MGLDARRTTARSDAPKRPAATRGGAPDARLDAIRYDFLDDEVVRRRARALDQLERYELIPADDLRARQRFLQEHLFGSLGLDADVRQGFRCERGDNIHAGSHLVVDMGCTILDAAPVWLGDWVIMGPHVLVSTVNHPLSPSQRRQRQATATPVRIGSDVWIGGNATILPSVTIGDNVVIGAGAVVTKDIPANSLALGVPARVVRTLEDDRPAR